MDTTDIAALQEENRRLRERLSAVEAAQPEPAYAPFFETLARTVLPAVHFWHRDDPGDIASLRLIYTHTRSMRPEFDISGKLGSRIREVLPHLPERVLAQYAEVLRTGIPFSSAEISDPRADGTEGVGRIQAIRLAPDDLCVIVEDITDRKRAEQAQRQLMEQQDIIRSQQASLLELSTPLIPITDHVMVMPLIGAIDSRRAQQVLEALLHGITSARATAAILDITGVPVVDTQVANALIQAAQAVKLLGAQVVLTGIRPEVAQTLVGLGVDLTGITTMSNLQSGIAYATAAL
ncbi:MAG TPA: STAS domain-containing protein [Herpetosiphonaceae bacterium]|nr:STAS domain-containing protein [Herpetosiphonaceae bacterium]